MRAEGFFGKAQFSVDTIPISIMTNETPEFYQLIGPFLANRVVAHAYGDRIWDDPGDIWAIAQTPEGQVMGFATLRPDRQGGLGALFCNDYVDPTYRDDQNEVLTRLLEALLERCQAAVTVRVVAAATEKEFYQTKGFFMTGKKGSFLIMIKTVGAKEA